MPRRSQGVSDSDFVAEPFIVLLQGDFSAAASNLQTCLSVLGRALPASRLDLACSLSWNVIRYSLQKLALVRWLLKRTSHQWRAREATAGFEDEAKTSARDAALAYHKLHQLHITGESRGSRSTLWFFRVRRLGADPGAYWENTAASLLWGGLMLETSLTNFRSHLLNTTGSCNKRTL